MNKLLLQKRAEHQNQNHNINNSLEYNHQKIKEKSPEKENKDYLQAKIYETYGKQKYKLNYFNVQFYPGENPNQEIKNNLKYRNIKRIIKKEQIFVKEKKIKKKENSKENLNTKTEFNYNYNIHTNILKYFKNSNLFSGKKITEIESHLDTLWKKLGVSEYYINNFNSYKNMIINAEEKEQFIINEIENLEKFKDIIYNLSKEIEIRENKLPEIKSLLEKINKETDINNLKKLLTDSNYIINSYLENSIRVVEYYLLYKEFLNQGNAKINKYNEEIIKRNFTLNKNDTNVNYLIKMKTDTNFINVIFSKSNELKLNKDIFNLFKGDPFLTCLNNIIQITPELKEKIKYCQHCIIQEALIESLNRIIKEPKTNSARKNSQTHIKIDAKLFQKNLNNVLEESKNNVKENNYFSIKPNININDNNNEKINIISNNNNDNLNISYYSGKISEFINIYSEYYPKIPEEQKIIFNLKEDPSIYFENNYYPKIIICRDKITNIIKGICIYSIIFKSYDNKPNEIIIDHISSYNKEEMENILTKFFEFIKSNHILKDLCKNGHKLNTEIYLDLYYFLVNEKFDINKNIRDFIGKKLKFKWVKLENISKIIRFQKMKYIINYDENINNNNNYSLCNNFSIKDNFIINFIKKLQDSNNLENNDIINIKKINPFNIIYIIYILKKIYNIKYSFDILLSKINSFLITKKIISESYLNEMAIISNENNPELNLYLLPEELKMISNCFNSNLINELDLNNKIDIFPLFDGCISTKYENYFYNRISCKDIKIVKENTTEQIFYLIKSINNENISILISSNLNEAFKNKYLLNNNDLNTNIHISLNFKNIYTNLIECEYDEKRINKYLYIPAFSIEQKYEIKNENNNEENILKDLNEEYKIEFLSEEIIAKKNNKIYNNFEFDKFDEDVNNNRECIINDEFMMFILDFDVIDKIGIYPIMSIDVHKDNFISCENN